MDMGTTSGASSRAPLAKGADDRDLPAKADGQAGFTLIEVLVAIVLLSIGVLGTVSLQAWALRSNVQARYQASAVRMSRELGELMRGNPAVAMQTSATNNPYMIDTSAAVPTTTGLTNCFTHSCASGVDVAKWDVAEWWGRTRSTDPGASVLPSPRVVVCYDDTPFDATGKPRWACDSATNAALVVKIGWTHASTNQTSGPVTAATPGVVLPISLQVD